MSLVLDKMPLREPTPAGWLPVILGDFASFMQDHASCERKASANAMSLVNKFSDHEAVVEPMICLAKEELAHFHEVYRLLQRRGIPLGIDAKDPYVGALLKPVRHSRQEYFLDRLLVGCLIESRSCERFTIVAEGLQDPELAPFYKRLAREEAGHFRIFLRLARHYFSEQIVDDRLQYLLDVETAAMLAAPVRAAVH
jgi:tRNA-(ms[2]io[6]A)-hydroxylase